MSGESYPLASRNCFGSLPNNHKDECSRPASGPADLFSGIISASRMTGIVDTERLRAKEAMLVNEHLRKPRMKKEEESPGFLNTLQG